MSGQVQRDPHPSPYVTKTPTHQHDSTDCVYLGTTGPTDALEEHLTIDHYWCRQGNLGMPTLLQRYGSGAHQYLSMPVRVCHPEYSRLRQTYELARRRGLLAGEN